MTRVYLIRHGTTDNNVKGIFQGTIDIELGEQGMKQAECLMKKFQNIKLDAVYTSPLKRARQTAEKLCVAHGLHARVEKQLCELDGGMLEGFDSERNCSLYPDEMYKLSHYPAQFAAPGGESSKEVYDRMVDIMNTIVKRHPNGSVAVVSHGFSIQLYLGYVKGVMFENMERYIVGNASVSVFDYDDRLNVRVVSINDETHIPEELRFYIASNFMSDK